MVKEKSIYDIVSIIDSISDGLIIVDTSLQIQKCNKAFEKLTFLNEDNILNRYLWEVKHAAGFAALKTEMETALQLQISLHSEVCLPAYRKWLSVNINPSADGLIIVFKDITHKRDAPNRILIDEQNLDILINVTDHPIWLADTNCNILLCNNAFKGWITAFTGKELGNGDNLLAKEYKSEYLDKFTACYQLAKSGKEFTSVEDIMIDGELKFMTIRFNPVFDSNDNLTGICCYATDITDHRKNLNIIETQAKVLMEIASMQSHKVRGPLSTILGLVNIFNYDDYTDPSNGVVVNGISTVANDLDKIVRQAIQMLNDLNKNTPVIK